jgi:dCMP deaminase
MPHCNGDFCGDRQRCLHTSHAEENALSFCHGPVATAYITNEPCLTCTRSLVRRGVRKIIFLQPYTSIGNQERLERDAIICHFGVQWIHLPKLSFLLPDQ